jgi:hypothetical protein
MPSSLCGLPSSKTPLRSQKLTSLRRDEATVLSQGSPHSSSVKLRYASETGIGMGRTRIRAEELLSLPSLPEYSHDPWTEQRVHLFGRSGYGGSEGRDRSDHSASISSLATSYKAIFLWKTCEQIVYTAREKPVGILPQKLWTTKRTPKRTTQPVHNSPTFPHIPQPSSTYLPTPQTFKTNLLESWLSALSTAPMITTTIYITNK